ncbi:hypothetical protein [Streptomyces caelestis]|uniref:hypothetical protein n=1 Tax=Streptomyces caelestis TaxID=36816 RepID=UPI0036FD39DA
MRFALGVPLSSGTDTPFQNPLEVTWDERFADDVEAALDGDGTEAVAAEQDLEVPEGAAGTAAGSNTSSRWSPTWTRPSGCWSCG